MVKLEGIHATSGNFVLEFCYTDSDSQFCFHRLNDLQSQARELEEKLAEEDVCRVDAQQTSAELGTLRMRHAELATQHEVTAQCAEEASATALALRAELDACQADLAGATREREVSNAAAEELRKTVVALRQDLAEHREKDAEAIARIQDAKEAAEKVPPHS
jgi:chromosome segregation ATPase